MTDAASAEDSLAREFLEKADALAPVLAGRAEEAEALRRVPDRSIGDLRDAGLFGIARPARYGGHELGLDHVIETVSRLGRGCGSTAWVFGIFCDHMITMGMMPEEAQEDIWGDDPDALVCSGLAPSGRVERVAGGLELSGRWQFSSGCDHAAWVFVQSAVPAVGGAAAEQAYLLVPRSDFGIVDTWHVSGLKGTGSKDIVIDKALVPEHRVEALAAFNAGTGPGGRLHEGAIFRMPRIATVPFSLVAPAVGVLDAMIDGFTTRVRGRASRGFRHAELTTMQLRVAEASAERDCARLLLRRATRETMEAMHAEGALGLGQRARNRRDMAYVSTLCTRAADRLHHATGASGLFDGNDMRRFWSDIRAIGAHYINSWDISGPIYGRVAFGLEPGNPSV